MVETIEFDEDEDEELPMLLTQRDVVLMNKAGPLEEDVEQPAAQLANGDAETVEMSEEERAMVAEADAAAAPVTTAADRAVDGVGAQQAVEEQQQPEAAPAMQVCAAAAAAFGKLLGWGVWKQVVADGVVIQEPKEDDMDMDVDDEPMRIVRNYQRHDAR